MSLGQGASSTSDAPVFLIPGLACEVLESSWDLRTGFVWAEWSRLQPLGPDSKILWAPAVAHSIPAGPLPAPPSGSAHTGSHVTHPVMHPVCLPGIPYTPFIPTKPQSGPRLTLHPPKNEKIYVMYMYVGIRKNCICKNCSSCCQFLLADRPGLRSEGRIISPLQLSF